MLVHAASTKKGTCTAPPIHAASEEAGKVQAKRSGVQAMGGSEARQRALMQASVSSFKAGR